MRILEEGKLWKTTVDITRKGGKVSHGKLLWKIKNSILTVMRAKVLKLACVMVERSVCLRAFLLPARLRLEVSERCGTCDSIHMTFPPAHSARVAVMAGAVPLLIPPRSCCPPLPQLTCLLSLCLGVCVCVCLPGCDSPPAADHLLTFDQPTPSTKLQQYWYRNVQRIRLQK